MNKLELDNVNNNNYFWRQIDHIRWYYLANDFGREANDAVSEYLLKNYDNVNDIIELHNFIVEQREVVKNYICGFLRGCPSYKKSNYRLSDDGTWDLASHIVGMGKVTMDLVFRKPEIIFILQDIKVENFEYGFDRAIFEFSNKKDTV